MRHRMREFVMPPPSPSTADSGSAEPTIHRSASTPDGSIYWREDRFQVELERLYYRSWLNVGREEQVEKSGDFLTRTLGPESLLFVRDSDGTIRGFYNVCRHRGTRLLEEPSGSGLQSITCPYHSWTYSLEGRLIGASHTRGLQNFDRKDFSLYPLRVETWGGFVWANLEPSGPALKDDLGPFFQRYERFPIRELRLGAKKIYEVEANWKILVENYSECYHCAPVHPALNRLTPYLSGDNDAYFVAKGPKSKFSGGYMTFAGDYTSMVRSGYTKRPPLRGMTEEDRTRVDYHVIAPNFFFSLHPDYLMIHRTWPMSPTHSTIENEFYFDPEVMARADFDPSDAVDLWDEINKQDWNVCERAQKGSRSRIWHGGRYSEQESLVCDFDLFVQDQMSQKET
jgi:Rieske 2Fe-2S family protein